MFVAGGYFGFYNGNYIGQIEDGFMIETGVSGEPVIGDNAGDAAQDIVIRPTNWYISFTLLEWSSSALYSMISPWIGQAAFQQNAGGGFGAMAVPGVLASAIYYPLVLNAISGPPAIAPVQFQIPNAATLGGKQWLFYKTGLVPDFPVRFLLAPRLRRIPLRFIILPVVVVEAMQSSGGQVNSVMGARYFEVK